MTDETALPTTAANGSLRQTTKDLASHMRQRRKTVASVCVAVACLIVAIVLAVSFGSSSSSSSNKQAVSSVASTTEGPPVSITEAPTGFLDQMLEDLPPSTLDSISTPATPQWKALRWLEAHPQLDTMPECRKKQLFAVATFFYAMGGDTESWPHHMGGDRKSWPLDTQQDWMQHDASECNWGWLAESTQFTSCNENDEIISLVVKNLNNAEDVFIPPEIALLTQLQVLDVSNNQIAMPLHDFLPSQLYQMENLQVLSLWENPFAGTIPLDLSLLTSLKTLDLSRTALSGTIPTELSLLNNLSFLHLHENPHLTGPIPSQLGLLTRMTDLYLRNNPLLTGTLPTQLGRLTELIKFNLGRCALTGTIPTEYGALTNLADRSIWLQGNDLTGTIPTQIGQWTDLGLLLLNHNRLSETIPTQIGRMTGLEEISLYQNTLAGPIPSQLGLLTDTTMGLARIYLYDNSLSGPIPSQLGLLWANGTGTVQGIRLQNNRLTGTVPEELCAMGLVENPNDWWEHGLLFDCNSPGKLCGCSWCACS